MVKIRKATMKDFSKLYSLGSRIPELKVNKHEPFMTKEEFKFAIKNPHGIFLLAEEDEKIVAFTYASIKKRSSHKIACLVYLAVHPKHRNKGIGKSLYEERLKRLKKRGVKYVYSWIGVSNKKMQHLAKKQGLKQGKKFFWFEKKI